MALIETEGLVLKNYNLAEADKIVIFLTKDHGVVRGVAKGAKRTRSRFGSALELFSIVKLAYFQKDVLELVSIRAAELHKSFFDTASDPEFLQKFSYLSDLLISFAPPHDPNETLYRMVRNCLETAAADRRNLSAIGCYFELWLLRLGGYLPDWRHCDDCGLAFGASEPSNLRINFHLLCSRCARSRGDCAVAAEHRGIYQAARTLAPAEFAALVREKPAFILDLSQILRRIISQIIGREVTGEKSLVLGS